MLMCVKTYIWKLKHGAISHLAKLHEMLKSFLEQAFFVNGQICFH